MTPVNAMSLSIDINGSKHSVDVDGDTPLLWVFAVLGLTGTKYGCGIAQCGACTVHIDGEAVRSCLLSVRRRLAIGAVTTIEGIGATEAGAKVQKAWLDLRSHPMRLLPVGQIMSAAALLANNPHPR